LLILNSI